MSHAGTVRQRNEDAYVDRPDDGIWAIADGAGGHQHGEIASGALKTMLDDLDRAGADLIADVRVGVASVHAWLSRQAAAEQATTGHPVMIASTFVVLLAHGAHFACLWCGDSRVYLLRAGQFVQLTRDHSLVQEMVDAGALRPEEAEQHPHANVLTRAIGADAASPDLDKVLGTAEPGDRFLLCSDGLFKALDSAQIARLTGSDAPATSLIDAALAAAARDNVTALVVAALDDPDPLGGDAARVVR